MEVFVIVVGIAFAAMSLAAKRVYDGYPRPDPNDDEEAIEVHERWLRAEYITKVWGYRAFACLGIGLALIGVRELFLS